MTNEQIIDAEVLDQQEPENRWVAWGKEQLRKAGQKISDYAWNHKKGVGITGAVALGLAGLIGLGVKAYNTLNAPQKVYSMNINGNDVTYFEAEGIGNERNRMEVTDRDTWHYTFLDKWGEDNLDMNSTKPEDRQTLSKVIIYDARGWKTEKTKNLEAYENAYNAYRQQIRNMLQQRVHRKEANLESHAVSLSR